MTVQREMEGGREGGEGKRRKERGREGRKEAKPRVIFRKIDWLNNNRM